MPFVGGLTILIGVGTLIKNFPDAINGKLTFLDYVGLATIIPMMIGFGFLSFSTLLTSKIIVSSFGLEYHSLMGIYFSDWQSLRCAGKVRQGEAGFATILYSERPKINLYSLAKWLPWNVEQGIVSHGIPLSWFGGINGERLKSEIETYAPHLLGTL
jgi:hypothetical protein